MSLFRNKASPGKSWWKRFRDYAALCTTSGFIPRENRAFQHIARGFARLWAWIQVGEVKVVGREHLTAGTHLIYCPNHSAMLDAAVIYPLIPLGTRYMSAVEEMRGLGGLKGILMGAAGCYPVDRTKGRSVIPASIDLVTSGKRLTMFPEGKISPTGKYLEFKKGAAWIALGASDALGSDTPVGIVPIHICYGTRDVESATDIGKMGLRWRHGVTVTIGEPVYVHNIQPRTAEEVISRIKDDITSQSCPTTHLD